MKLTPKRLVESIRKQHGDQSALLLAEGGFAKVKAVIPTGLNALDRYVIGLGGLPMGRLIELFGEEGGGKTTILCRWMAAVQKAGGLAVLVDSEYKFDIAWATLHGVKADEVVLTQPTCMEDALDHIDLALDKASPEQPMIIGWDSVASSPTRKEMDGEAGDMGMAEVARLLSRNVKKFQKRVAEKAALLVFVNQVREKIGIMYGDKWTTPGGHAIKFHSALRLAVFPGKQVKEGDTCTGRHMTVVATKNQVSLPHRKARLKLDFHTGFDDEWATLDHAKEVGCVANSCRSVAEAMENLGWASS